MGRDTYASGVVCLGVMLCSALVACGGPGASGNDDASTPGTGARADGGAADGGTGGTGGMRDGGDSDAPASTATAVSADDFVALYVEAKCRSGASCCDQRDMPMDPGICDVFEDYLRDSWQEAVVDNPNVSFDAAAAGRCIASTREQVRSCVYPGAYICPDVLAGTLGLGDACQYGTECADPDAYCTDPDDDDVLVCVVDEPRPVVVPLGESCNGTYWANGSSSLPSVGEDQRRCQREDGAYCDRIDRVCVPLKPIDAVCTSSFECELALLCEQRSCQPRGVLDAACQYGPDCADGLACVESICVSRVALGEVCDRETQLCEDGLLCWEDRCVDGDPYVRICIGDFD